MKVIPEVNERPVHKNEGANVAVKGKKSIIGK